MLAAAALLSTLCPPASAESVRQELAHRRARLSRPTRGEPTYSLDTLFSALKIAPDEASAKAIEDRIWAVWTASGSDTCNLLMSREKAATDAKDMTSPSGCSIP